MCFPVPGTRTSSDYGRTSGPDDPFGPRRSQSELQSGRIGHDVLGPPVSEERLLIAGRRDDPIQDGKRKTTLINLNRKSLFLK